MILLSHCTVNHHSRFVKLHTMVMEHYIKKLENQSFLSTEQSEETVLLGYYSSKFTVRKHILDFNTFVRLNSVA